MHEVCKIDDLPPRDVALRDVGEHLMRVVTPVLPEDVAQSLSTGGVSLALFEHWVAEEKIDTCPWVDRLEQDYEDRGALAAGLLRDGVRPPESPAWMMCGAEEGLQYDALSDPGFAYDQLPRTGYRAAVSILDAPVLLENLVWVRPGLVGALAEGDVVLAVHAELKLADTRMLVDALASRSNGVYLMARPFVGSDDGAPVDAVLCPDSASGCGPRRLADRISSRLYFDHPEARALLSETVVCDETVENLIDALPEELRAQFGFRQGAEPVIIVPLRREEVRVMKENDPVRLFPLAHRIIEHPLVVSAEEVKVKRRTALLPLHEDSRTCTADLTFDRKGRVVEVDHSCVDVLERPDEMLRNWSIYPHELQRQRVRATLRLEIRCSKKGCTSE